MFLLFADRQHCIPTNLIKVVIRVTFLKLTTVKTPERGQLNFEHSKYLDPLYLLLTLNMLPYTLVIKENVLLLIVEVAMVFDN